MTKSLFLSSSLLVASLVTLGCGSGPGGRGSTGAAAVQQVGSVNVAVVQKGVIETGPALSGTLEPATEATVRAQVSATVTATFVEMGQRVRRGAPLATLDDATLRQSLRAAQVTAASAELTAEHALRDAERQRRLFAIEAVSQSTVESAERSAGAAEASLADARTMVQNAEQQLSYAHVTAPITGVVNERSVSRGDALQIGTTMFTIVDPTTLRLRAHVPSEDLGGLRLGAPVQFTVRGYPGRTFTGRITAISPAADTETRQVQVLASIPNQEGTLVARLFASGRVTTRSESGWIVPTDAIDTRQVAPAVMRVRNGCVERVNVQIGLRDDVAGRARIIGAVAAGDTLLLGSAQQLAVGSRVTVAGNAAASSATGGTAR